MLGRIISNSVKEKDFELCKWFSPTLLVQIKHLFQIGQTTIVGKEELIKFFGESQGLQKNSYRMQILKNLHKNVCCWALCRESYIYDVCKIFWKTNICYPQDMHTYVCSYQG